MLMGDIRDHAHIKFTGIHAILRPAVRGRFQHHMGQAGLDHAGKIMLDIMGIRRGHVETRIQDLIPNHRIDG